ncbi:MAG: hypothetical protein ACYDEC_05540 [Bacteroidia bacterium]
MHLDKMAAFTKEHHECITVTIPYNAEVEKMGEYMAPIAKAKKRVFDSIF